MAAVELEIHILSGSLKLFIFASSSENWQCHRIVTLHIFILMFKFINGSSDDNGSQHFCSAYCVSGTVRSPSHIFTHFWRPRQLCTKFHIIMCGADYVPVYGLFHVRKKRVRVAKEWWSQRIVIINSKQLNWIQRFLFLSLITWGAPSAAVENTDKTNKWACLCAVLHWTLWTATAHTPSPDFPRWSWLILWCETTYER